MTEEIQHWAKTFNSRVILNEETTLTSQFRCNGSDLYIQFLNNLLQIGEPVDIDVSDLHFDIKIFDDPNELRNELRKKMKKTTKHEWLLVIVMIGM